MLHTVTIQDFQRIDNQGLSLRKLARVNYLVGENGSGKSSILQAIYANLTDELFPSLEITLENSKIYTIGRRKTGKYKTIYINQDLRSLLEYHGNCGVDTDDLQDYLVEEYSYMEWGLYTSSFQEKNFELDSHKLVYEEYLENYLEQIPQREFSLILIEEPENYLHPTWEKSLAYIYQRLSRKFNCQFFIATHSPFIVSAAGEITEIERKKSGRSKSNFIPSQKVYLIDGGKTTSKSGRKGQVPKKDYQIGSDGYWGKKVGYVAANLLGAGLQDFISKVKPNYTKDAPYLIFCEGEGNDQDATVYNKIFQNHYPHCLFVSTRGVSEMEYSFSLLKEIKNGLSGNFKILMLRDRDHEFPRGSDLQKYEARYPNRKVLRKRAIEAYIYSFEIVEKWLNSKGYEFPENLRKDYELTEKLIQRQVKLAVKGSEYKKMLNSQLAKVWRYYMQKEKKNDKINAKRFSVSNSWKKELVAQITPKTKVYQDLEKIIFR